MDFQYFNEVGLGPKKISLSKKSKKYINITENRQHSLTLS